MKIRLKKGSRLKVDADTVFKAIEDSKVDGDVSLQKLVDDSKPKSAPLHAEFLWNTAQAANKWRLHEARKIVQSIEVVHDSRPPTRAYESVTVTEVTETEEAPKAKRVFRSIGEVMGDPETRSEVLMRAINDFHALRKRYAGLQELAKVHAAIDQVIVDREAG